MATALAAWASCAAALDREGAIDAVKRQVKNRCSPATPCTFTAKPEKSKWVVRVEFTKPGGHAIYMLDQSGKIVGRIASE
jgi:hypothetical protein